MNTSFGQGELLGFTLAVFAAAFSRWIVHQGRGELIFRSLGLIGIVFAAIAVSFVWFDNYLVATDQIESLIFPRSNVVLTSLILAGASVACGAASEVGYALSVRPSAVTVD
jgi:hypothetical protein